MFVKPGINKSTGKPLVIRVPRTHALMPESGMDVPGTAFWLRRLRDGDVVKCAAPVTAKVPPSISKEMPKAA
ncbi:MAG: DUF2635 domain-containing protein [Betaproteobacteria bacterium]|nr:DUF2635 domain-containing protein [Betaproteobacteria bacterium]